MFLPKPLFAKTNHCKIQKLYKKADYFTWDSAFESKKKTGPWYCDLERLISHEIPGVGQTKTCLKLTNKTVKCCKKIKGIVLASDECCEYAPVSWAETNYVSHLAFILSE